VGEPIALRVALGADGRSGLLGTGHSSLHSLTGWARTLTRLAVQLPQSAPVGSSEKEQGKGHGLGLQRSQNGEARAGRPRPASRGRAYAEPAVAGTACGTPGVALACLAAPFVEAVLGDRALDGNDPPP
jgi:hypothetical protein